MPVTLIIAGVEVKARKGEKLLWVALDNGFYIPNLCAIRGVEPPFASCRLCFVEIKGRQDPVTSCTEPVSDGMVVHLNTPRVYRLQSAAFEFLLSHHHLDCAHCAKNKHCGLQEVASRLKLRLKPRRLKQILRNLPVDSSHQLFIYDPNKCILCGKCVWVCQEKGTGALDFAFRGINTMVSTFAGRPLVEADCEACLACVQICPVGALVPKEGVPSLFIPRAGI